MLLLLVVVPAMVDEELFLLIFINAGLPNDSVLYVNELNEGIISLLEIWNFYAKKFSSLSTLG